MTIPSSSVAPGQQIQTISRPIACRPLVWASLMGGAFAATMASIWLAALYGSIVGISFPVGLICTLYCEIKALDAAGDEFWDRVNKAFPRPK